MNNTGIESFFKVEMDYVGSSREEKTGKKL
jgi:hypothetical protein